MLFHKEQVTKRKLNVCTNVKTSNRIKLHFKVLVDLECIYTRINEQLVKEEQIKTEPMPKSFKVFNTDRTKNRKVIQFASLKLKVNKHTKIINAVLMDINSTNMFLVL